MSNQNMGKSQLLGLNIYAALCKYANYQKDSGKVLKESPTALNSYRTSL
jgi:hypothetical protein